MNDDMKISAEDAFQAMLEGRVRRAPAHLAALGALASALEPAERPGPDPRFRRRLRNEMLAAAATGEEDLFAAAIDGELVDARVGGLVAVASALAETGTTQPDPRFRFALRNRLIELGEHRGVRVPRLGRARRASRLAVAFGAAAMLMSGATLAAAQDALPGDVTYGVKLAHERVSLWTVSGTAEGVRKLDFSRRRLTEVRGLTERGDERRPLYTTTLNRMDSLTIDAADLILDGFAQNRDARDAVEHLSSFADAQASDLASLLDRLPPEVRPAARDSLGLVETTATRAEAALVGCVTCPEVPEIVPDAEAPTSGDAGAGVPPTTCQACGSAGESSDPEVSNGTGGTGSSGGSGSSGSGNGDSDGDDNGDPDGDTDPPPAPEGDEPVVDVPPVEGTDVDDDVEDEIDELIDGLGIEPPVLAPPAPSLPPAGIAPLG